MISKEFLQEEYVVKKRPFSRIAKKLGCDKSTVMYWAKKHGIQSRTGGRKRADLVGQKFGDLVVLRYNETKSCKHPQWVCLCKCGRETLTTASALLPRSHGKPPQRRCWDCRNKLISEMKWKGFGEISGEFWDKIKNGAYTRNFSFELTIEQIWDLYLEQDKKCALSGVEIGFTRRKAERSNITASLDRIDSSKGYTIENVQWVHKIINLLKLDLPEAEFINWCRLVAKMADHKIQQLLTTNDGG